MYDREYWHDLVMSPPGRFHITKQSDGTYTITRAGTTMQDGTSQDQNHWNSMEERITDDEISTAMLINAFRLREQDIENVDKKDIAGLMLMEKGTVSLTNALDFPFNNSLKSVPLKANRKSTDYIVTILSVDTPTGNVGDIEVTDRLVNGFKLAYTGSAKSVTITYMVTGGYWS
jgi:hypothetical protein